MGAYGEIKKHLNLLIYYKTGIPPNTLYLGTQLVYLSNELQHGLNTLHNPICFTTNQHHAVSGLRAALLEQLDGSLCALV